MIRLEFSFKNGLQVVGNVEKVELNAFPDNGNVKDLLYEVLPKMGIPYPLWVDVKELVAVTATYLPDGQAVQHERDGEQA